MRKESLPTGIERFDGTILAYDEIYHKFSESLYGHILKGRARFASFKPNNMSDQDWINTLSLDVDNMKHMFTTFEFTAAFLKESHDDYSFEEKQLLLFTAMVHDMGEAVVGDIPKPEKTNETEELEMKCLGQIVHEVMDEEMEPNVANNLVDNMLDILTNKETKLGQAFDSVERIGYAKTALKGWKESKEIENEGLKTALRNMAQAVVPGDIPILINYAKVFPYVKLHLKQNANEITEVLENIKSSNKNGNIRKIESCWSKFNASLVH